MYAAGKRETHPPDRLIDRLLDPNNLQMSSTSSSTTTSENVMADPTTPSNQGSNKKTDVSLSDLLGFMKEAKEENKQRFDKLDKSMNVFVQRQDAIEARTTKIEKNVSTIHRAYQEQSATVSRIDQDVNNLKDTVRKIQNSNSITTLPQTNLCNLGNASLNNTDMSYQQMNPNCTSILSSSMNQTERLLDIVSEFTGKRYDLHPEKFLCQLEQYFQYHCPSNDQRIELFQRRLTGNARVWFDSLIPIPSVYTEVTSLFRQQFWSASTQRKIRNEIFQPYQYRSPNGITTHAMTWIAKAKYLSPPIDQFDLVGIIIQHYPSALGMAIRGRGPQTTNALLTILNEIEESTSFCDMSNNRSQDNRPPHLGRNNENFPRNYQGRRDHQHHNNDRNNYRNVANHESQSLSRTPAQNEPIINQINVPGNANEARV
jgi:hypothetical protein